LPRPFRAAAFLFERCEAEGFVALPPFVEALAGDAEVPTGQGGVLSVRAVEVHPGEPFLRLFGEHGDAGEGNRPGQNS